MAYMLLFMRIFYFIKCLFLFRVRSIETVVVVNIT